MLLSHYKKMAVQNAAPKKNLTTVVWTQEKMLWIYAPEKESKVILHMLSLIWMSTCPENKIKDIFPFLVFIGWYVGGGTGIINKTGWCKLNAETPGKQQECFACILIWEKGICFPL